MNENLSIIPCEPGWRAVYEEDHADGTRGLWVGHAVLAWGIKIVGQREDKDPDCEVFAITTSGETGLNDKGFFGYMRPDGVIECPYVETFDNIAEALSDLKSRKK